MIAAITIGSRTCDEAVARAAERAAETDRPLGVAYVADTTFMRELHVDVRGEAGDLRHHLRTIGELILARHRRDLAGRTVAAETEVIVGRPERVIVDWIVDNDIKELFIGAEVLDVLARASDPPLRQALEQTGVGLRVVEDDD